VSVRPPGVSVSNIAHPYDCKDDCIHVQRSLVDSRRKCRVEALRETLGNDELSRYLCIRGGEGLVSLHPRLPTLSRRERNEIKSAHSLTLSNVVKHLSTRTVYFL
jgi:hypothetical protein